MTTQEPAFDKLRHAVETHYGPPGKRGRVILTTYDADGKPRVGAYALDEDENTGSVAGLWSFLVKELCMAYSPTWQFIRPVAVEELDEDMATTASDLRTTLGASARLLVIAVYFESKRYPALRRWSVLGEDTANLEPAAVMRDATYLYETTQDMLREHKKLIANLD